MPNWCEHDLVIQGNPEDIAKFKDFAKSENSVLDQNKFIPYPKKFLPALKVFRPGEYEWRKKHWGTKWEIEAPSLYEGKTRNGKTTLQYFFLCAWSPCLPIILAMGKKFKSLQFKLHYYEPGMEFQGDYVIKNGKVITDKQWAYKSEINT